MGMYKILWSFLFFNLFIRIILCRRKEIPTGVGDFISPVTVQKTEFVSWMQVD